MLSLQFLNKTFSCRVVILDQDKFTILYSIEYIGNVPNQPMSVFTLEVPRLCDDGIIRRICKIDRYAIGFVTVGGKQQTCRERLESIVKERQLTLDMVYRKTGIANGFFIQSGIDKFVNALPNRDENPLSDFAAKHKVVFDIPAINDPFKLLAHLRRLFQVWKGKIDLIDTPASEKVGRVGYKAYNEHGLGPCLSKVPFIPLVAPKRLAMLGSIMRGAVKTIGTEPPIVQVNPEIPDAPSVNALCIFMIHPLNHEDGIVCSESFAKKMTMYRHVKVTLMEPSSLNVKEGDTVRNGDVAGYVSTGNVRINSLGLFNTGLVSTIEEEMRVVSNKLIRVVIVHIVIEHKMYDGDKVSTRGAMKGIVSIVPDKNMPVFEGKYADLIFNPLCMISRGNFNQLVEGWKGLLLENRRPVVFDSWDTITLDEARKELDLPDCGRHTIVLPGGNKAKAFVGIIAIMRLNKIVSGMASCCGDTVATNLHGAEDPGCGAVKLSAPELTALKAVGATAIIDEILSHTTGNNRFYHSLKVLIGPQGRLEVPWIGDEPQQEKKAFVIGG